MDHIYPANSNEKDPLKSIKAASKVTDNIEVEEDLANPEKQPVIRPRPQRVRLTRSNSLTTPACLLDANFSALYNPANEKFPF